MRTSARSRAGKQQVGIYSKYWTDPAARGVAVMAGSRVSSWAAGLAIAAPGVTGACWTGAALALCWRQRGGGRRRWRRRPADACRKPGIAAWDPRWRAPARRCRVFLPVTLAVAGVIAPCTSCAGVTRLRGIRDMVSAYGTGRARIEGVARAHRVVPGRTANCTRNWRRSFRRRVDGFDTRCSRSTPRRRLSRD
jgi:hypothetical protein